MQEKRSQLRGQLTDYLIVHDKNSDRVIGRVMNMSVDGMMMMSEEPIEISNQFECRIALPEKYLDSDHVFFDAETLWCKKNMTIGMYDVGLRMTTIDDANRKIIIHLLSKCIVAPAETPSIDTSDTSLRIL